MRKALTASAGCVLLSDQKPTCFGSALLVTLDNVADRTVSAPATDHSSVCPINFRRYGIGLPPYDTGIFLLRPLQLLVLSSFISHIGCVPLLIFSLLLLFIVVVSFIIMRNFQFLKERSEFRNEISNMFFLLR